MRARQESCLIALCRRGISGGGEGCASHQPPTAAARALGGATFATSLKQRKELEVCAFCGVTSVTNPVV